jgi:hypothetical protein
MRAKGIFIPFVERSVFIFKHFKVTIGLAFDQGLLGAEAGAFPFWLGGKHLS